MGLVNKMKDALEKVKAPIETIKNVFEILAIMVAATWAIYVWWHDLAFKPQRNDKPFKLSLVAEKKETKENLVAVEIDFQIETFHKELWTFPCYYKILGLKVVNEDTNKFSSDDWLSRGNNLKTTQSDLHFLTYQNYDTTVVGYGKLFAKENFQKFDNVSRHILALIDTSFDACVVYSYAYFTEDILPKELYENWIKENNNPYLSVDFEKGAYNKEFIKLVENKEIIYAKSYYQLSLWNEVH